MNSTSHNETASHHSSPLAVMTYEMVMEEVAPSEVLHEPASKDRTFTRVSSRFGLEISMDSDVSDTLFVSNETDGGFILEQYPEAFVLITLTKGRSNAGAMPENALIVRHERYEDVLQRMQDRLRLQQAKAYEELLGALDGTKQTGAASHITGHEDILLKLLEGAHVDAPLLESFVTDHALTPDQHLRLLCADTSALSARELTKLDELLVRSFANLMERVYIESRCFFMLRSGPSNATLSNKAIEDTLNEHVLPHLNVWFASSQVYADIRETRFAKREIDLVSKYSTYVDISCAFMAANNPYPHYYAFEDCVLYALMDNDALDPDFKDFCFDHTPVAILMHEDLINGTNNVRILLMYQHYARHANVVAEKLHMHRNTVLYHINKIQNRFGIDLEDPRIQERIMVDAKMTFKRLAYSPADLEHLIGPFQSKD